MDLQVNVAQLLKGSVGDVRLLSLEDKVLEFELEKPATVSGRLQLTRTYRGVWVAGAVAISAGGRCSRCLAPFSRWLDVELDDVFLPTVDVETGARLRYDDDESPDAVSIDRNHMLDLAEVLRQYRIAATPLAPLCRDDCKGICPECGTDLNESTCACEAFVDVRWATLRELLR